MLHFVLSPNSSPPSCFLGPTHPYYTASPGGGGWEGGKEGKKEVDGYGGLLLLRVDFAGRGRRRWGKSIKTFGGRHTRTFTSLLPATSPLARLLVLPSASNPFFYSLRLRSPARSAWRTYQGCSETLTRSLNLLFRRRRRLWLSRPRGSNSRMSSPPGRRRRRQQARRRTGRPSQA